MKCGRWLLPILVLVVALPVAAMGINSSIRVESGEVVDDDLSTVNGQIRIHDGATVRGDAETVNGSVEVGRDARLEGVSSVNGSVRVGEGTVVDGDVETVNGPIEMEIGSRAQAVGTVNGRVKLSGADIEGEVTTYRGNVTLRDGANVRGDIRVVDSNSRSSRQDRPLQIRIEDGSTVQGDVIVEDEDLEVEVHLNGGTVAGQIRGAKIK